MTVTSIKVKVQRRPTVKAKLWTRFPSQVTGEIAIAVEKSGGNYAVKPDYTGLAELLSFDPTQELILAYNRDGTWAVVPASTLINNSSTSVRIVTEAGDITVGNNTRLLIMNRSANESPSKIYLPASDLKIGDVTIVDWKGNSGSYPHDVYTSGTDKLNGNLSSWQVGADGASLRFSPIPALGYAV